METFAGSVCGMGITVVSSEPYDAHTKSPPIVQLVKKQTDFVVIPNICL